MMLSIQKNLTNFFYALITLPATAMGFALSVQISALSWILDSKYHLRIDEVGYVWAAGPLAGILGQVIVGLISDKVWFWGGRRKPFILIGGPLAAIMMLALPFLGEINAALGNIGLITVAIVVALTLDLAINISFNPTRSVIADVIPEGDSRTKGYTWMQTVSGFFGVLAYVLGATLGNYTLIYFGVFIVLLLSVVPVFFIEEPRVLGGSQEGTTSGEKEGSGTFEILKLFFAHGFSWIGIQTMFVFSLFFIQQRLNPASKDEAGQINSIAFAILNTVGFIFPALVLQPLATKIGRVRTHLASVAVMALGYLYIFVFAHSAFTYYTGMVIAGIGWAAVVSLPFAILSEKVNSAKMGLFMGLFNLSVVIPQLIVSFGVGKFIISSADNSIIFLVCAVSLGISALLWIDVKETGKPKSALQQTSAH